MGNVNMAAYQIGDRVTLTPAMKRAAIEPERYESGTIVRIGSWNTIDVLWNGIDHPITIRSDEVVTKICRGRGIAPLPGRKEVDERYD